MRRPSDDLAAGAGGGGVIVAVTYLARRLGVDLDPETAATLAGAAVVVGAWLRRRFTDTPGAHAADRRPARAREESIR